VPAPMPAQEKPPKGPHHSMPPRGSLGEAAGVLREQSFCWVAGWLQARADAQAGVQGILHQIKVRGWSPASAACLYWMHMLRPTWR
jgi:hypothetical protein